VRIAFTVGDLQAAFALLLDPQRQAGLRGWPPANIGEVLRPDALSSAATTERVQEQTL
jgi:hypothetical protein